ncbi:MAG: tripartite tricarboxylate transporter TctB family protein [Betaproteobacteria bacterium]|nr:tripartite tricarboxylate transporter TctB family protein [Betaproteobacteria bacterium]MDH3436487.1 tripartite tricarboxylate transporter TctB family protein [Betaproteobacteria bacterium]
MEERNESNRALARVVTIDMVVALIVFALGALVVYESYQLGSSWGSDGPQAGYFPFYIGLLICISGTMVFVQSLLRLRSDAKVFVERAQLKQVMIVLIPTVAYVLSVQLIGIYVSAMVFIGLFMRFVGKYRGLRSAIVGVTVSVIAFALFEIWFKIPLPKGPVESLLGY